MKKPEIVTIAILALVLVFSLAMLLRPEPSEEPVVGEPAPAIVNTEENTEAQDAQ